MNSKQRSANAAKVYQDWIKANPKMDPDNPTPEQENDYFMRLYESDPDVAGKGWADAVSKMSEEEITQYLDDQEKASPETANSFRVQALMAAVDESTDELVGLVLFVPSSGTKGLETEWVRVDGEWVPESVSPLADMSEDDLVYYPVTDDYILIYDGGSRSIEDAMSHKTEIPEPVAPVSSPITAAAFSCPAPTQDIPLNLANRQKAIDGAGYGPMNPTRPNEQFWQAKADRWSTTVEEAKSSKCGNCAAFIITASMRECINQGLGDDADSWNVINAGDLGYCEAFDFKCASERTCDAWIVGGPITEEK